MKIDKKKTYQLIFMEMYTPVKICTCGFSMFRFRPSRGQNTSSLRKEFFLESKTSQSNHIRFLGTSYSPLPQTWSELTKCLGFILFLSDPGSVLKATSLFLQFLVDILPHSIRIRWSAYFWPESKNVAGILSTGIN